MILEALSVGAHILIVVAAIVHMNAMTRKTPKFEIVTWWLLGVGSASEAWIGPVAHWFTDPLFTVGVMMLVVLCAQPEWRPILADRRKEAAPVLPPGCDRRCQTILGLRRNKNTDGDVHGHQS